MSNTEYKVISVHGRQYRLEAVWHATAARYHWNAYRQTPYGWIKIPAWTRSEIERYPKSVALQAHEFVGELNRSRGVVS